MNIRVCTLECLDEAALFAFERNVIEELRCRPFLIDESLESIKKVYREYIEGESRDVLLQYEENSLVGVTGVYWIEEDAYLSFTNGIFFEGDYSTVAGGFMKYVSKKFSGYKLYINTANEHVKSVAYYERNGFALLEDAVLYVLTDYKDFDVEEGVEFIDDGNANFIWNRLESIITPDTYWNVERVKKNLDKFIVLGYFDREIEGALYAQIYKDSSVEVFGIAADNPKVAESLMRALAFQCGKLRSRRLWLYTDEEAEVELALHLGFTYFDSNKCFMKTI